MTTTIHLCTSIEKNQMYQTLNECGFTKNIYHQGILSSIHHNKYDDIMLQVHSTDDYVEGIIARFRHLPEEYRPKHHIEFMDVSETLPNNSRAINLLEQMLQEIPDLKYDTLSSPKYDYKDPERLQPLINYLQKNV